MGRETRKLDLSSEEKIKLLKYKHKENNQRISYFTRNFKLIVFWFIPCTWMIDDRPLVSSWICFIQENLEKEVFTIHRTRVKLKFFKLQIRKVSSFQIQVVCMCLVLRNCNFIARSHINSSWVFSKISYYFRFMT